MAATTWTAPGAAPTVLCVDDDPDYLDVSAVCLREQTAFEVRTETDPRAVLDSLDGVDCVVSDYAMPGMDGHELLAAVRERRPSLPFVLCTGSSMDDLFETVIDREWTEVVRKDRPHTTASLVAERVRRLLATRRWETLARRAVAALDETREGVAVVDSDGTFAVVNRTFARRFGYDRADLIGRDWRTCYPDEESDRIESTALESVREEWRWTASCVGLRADGETFSARTCVVGLDGDGRASGVGDGDGRGGSTSDGDRRGSATSDREHRDAVSGFVILVAADERE